MSEQSGPITREQVERLLADTLAGGNAFSSFYRSPQRELAPAYVLGAWEEDGGLRDVMEPALARWRDELAAAEPVPPEVVDVPQPRIVVKRCDEVEAEWTSADATILIVTHDALDDAIFVPIALLRAMLEAIDAQQGGAS